ncbi:MAG: hypothetical protein LBJ31_06590 [Treponema sp.]|jgi:hypothetical protein|nr:hypothetical protein [Treponema sp.]
MKKFIIIAFAVSCFSCKNDVKYVRYEDIEKVNTVTMEGYLIYRNYKDKMLHYFDVENNADIKTPFGITNPFNNNHSDYDFCFFNGKRVVVSYGLSEQEEILLTIYTFPDFTFLKKIDTGCKINSKSYYKFKYIPETNELFIVNLGSDNMIIELNSGHQKLVSFDPESYCIANYTGSDPQTGLTDSYPFLGSRSYRFSNVFGKVIYRKKGADGNYCINIYDLNTGTNDDTGLPANKILLYARDKYQYSFMGKNLLLHGVTNNDIAKNIKYFFESLLSGGMKTDPPLIYKIYDLENKRDIGYFKNIDLFDILAYY